jgi:outer membrane lipoprotein carrier protein
MFVAITIKGPAMYPMVFIAEFCLLLNTGPLNAAVVDSVGASIRALAVAVNLIVIHALGDALSATLIGYVSDRMHSLLSGFMPAVAAVLLSSAILLYGRRYAPSSVQLLPPVTRVTSLLVLAALCCGVAVGQNDVHAIAERVDSHYNRLQTLQADFVETYSGAAVSRTESGTLLLKRPGRMRWDYREPREKLFVTDGKTAWFYVPGERQAQKIPMKKLEDLRSPLAYLLGRTRLEKEFSGLSRAPDIRPQTAGNVVLRGIPRHMGGVTQVLMEVAPDGAFRRIVVDQEDGSRTSFDFLNQRENLAVSDQRFRFVLPQGVETIETDTIGG